MSDELRETISRSAMLLMASNYTSAFKALMELIDNPIDYRGHRHLRIDVIVDKDDDRIMVRDIGGEGMNRDSLMDWLRWGEGHEHIKTDIGQYHIGGKLACIFLADHLQISCRRAGEREIWHFDDPEWGTRTEFIPHRIVRRHVSDLSWAGSLPDDEIGFTQFTLRSLKRRRFDITRLKNNIADTYQTLLHAGVFTITVTYKGSTETISPPDVPWTEDVALVSIPREELEGGITISGRIGGLDRGKRLGPNARRLPAGVRTDFNGRTITFGETFGRNLAGRGTSQRLYGEISISGKGLLPTQNKEGWDKDSPGWQHVEALVQPIVEQVERDLNNIAGRRPLKEAANPGSKTSVAEDPSLARDKHSLRQGAKWRPQSPKRSPKPSSRTVMAWDSESEMIEEARGRIENALAFLKSSDYSRTEDGQALVERLAVTELPSVGFQSVGGQEPRYEWIKDMSGNRELRLNKLHPLLRKAKRGESALFEAILTAICLDLREEVPQFSFGTMLSVLDELHWIDSVLL